MNNIKNEIARVKEAIRKTDSLYLKRDYEKYLKKLERKMKHGKVNCAI